MNTSYKFCYWELRIYNKIQTACGIKASLYLHRWTHSMYLNHYGHLLVGVRAWLQQYKHFNIIRRIISNTKANTFLPSSCLHMFWITAKRCEQLQIEKHNFSSDKHYWMEWFFSWNAINYLSIHFELKSINRRWSNSITNKTNHCVWLRICLANFLCFAPFYLYPKRKIITKKTPIISLCWTNFECQNKRRFQFFSILSCVVALYRSLIHSMFYCYIVHLTYATHTQTHMQCFRKYPTCFHIPKCSNTMVGIVLNLKYKWGNHLAAFAHHRQLSYIDAVILFVRFHSRYILYCHVQSISCVAVPFPFFSNELVVVLNTVQNMLCALFVAITH